MTTTTHGASNRWSGEPLIDPAYPAPFLLVVLKATGTLDRNKMENAWED
jgi:hypothetical protein